MLSLCAKATIWKETNGFKIKTRKKKFSKISYESLRFSWYYQRILAANT